MTSRTMLRLSVALFGVASSSLGYQADHLVAQQRLSEALGHLGVALVAEPSGCLSGTHSYAQELLVRGLASPHFIFEVFPRGQVPVIANLDGSASVQECSLCNLSLADCPPPRLLLPPVQVRCQEGLRLDTSDDPLALRGSLVLEADPQNKDAVTIDTVACGCPVRMLFSSPLCLAPGQSLQLDFEWEVPSPVRPDGKVIAFLSEGEVVTTAPISTAPSWRHPIEVTPDSLGFSSPQPSQVRVTSSYGLACRSPQIFRTPECIRIESVAVVNHGAVQIVAKENKAIANAQHDCASVHAAVMLGDTRYGFQVPILHGSQLSGPAGHVLISGNWLPGEQIAIYASTTELRLAYNDRLPGGYRGLEAAGFRAHHQLEIPLGLETVSLPFALGDKRYMLVGPCSPNITSFSTGWLRAEFGSAE